MLLSFMDFCYKNKSNSYALIVFLCMANSNIFPTAFLYKKAFKKYRFCLMMPKTNQLPPP